jgi:hypothetical protein
MRELGDQAVRAVLARIRDRDAERQEIVLPTEPVLRRSCGCRARPGASRKGSGHRPAGRTVA